MLLLPQFLFSGKDTGRSFNGVEAVEKPDCQNTIKLTRTNGKLTEEDTTFLFETTRILFELTDKDDIFEFIAASIHRFLYDSIVIVNSYNEASDTLRVRAIAGLGTHIDRIICLLGSHPLETSVTMNKDARAGLTSGSLERVAGGLYELATGTMPRIVCSSIESILNINGTYAIGITWRGKFIGSIAMLIRSNIRATAIIESLANCSAVALH